MDKYLMTQSWLKRLAPDLKVHELSRITYQQLINDYAVYHEKQTTMDFHHQLKCAILDAVDEGLIERDPTRKVIIKGRPPKAKKVKYLNQFELHTLLNTLNLEPEINWDWFILLVAKTGMRFSEALALTPKDFDFPRQTLSVSKTWNYKRVTAVFLPTKNQSSVRKIQMDWMTVIQFSRLVKKFAPETNRYLSNAARKYTIQQSMTFWKDTVKKLMYLLFRYTDFVIPTPRFTFCGRFNRKCSKTTWSRKHDNNTENVFTYHTRARKQGY